MTTIPITILSVVYMLLLTIVYFSKERIHNAETRIYSHMIRISLFGIFIDAVSCFLLIYNLVETPIFVMASLFMFVYYILWSCLFLVYIFIISFKKPNISDKEFLQKKKYVIGSIFGIYTICAFLVIFLPISYHVENGIVFPEGPGVNLTYFIAGFVSIALMFVFLVINRKQVKSKKYVPLYALLVLLGVATIIQKLNPGLILTTAVECFITFLMYFTVENPDVQMIRELYKNKQLIENTNDDNTRFIFRVTQDIKNPIKELIDTSNNMKTMSSQEELKEASQYINAYATQLDYIVNNALNISNIDSQKLKVFETRYNVENLFNEINYRIQKEKNEDVEFNFTMDKSLPKYLYGDTIKIKQAITAILLNSVKYTKKGFINLEISSIIKYDVCRLIIQIEDSGEGMDIEEVNNILSLESEDLEQIDIENIEETNLGTKAIKKIVNVLGGSLLVKSDRNKGTTVTVVLDQKIVKINEDSNEKKLENLEKSLSDDKKVLVIDNDETEITKITDFLNNKEYKVSSSVYARDCVEQVRSDIEYDLIIINDEMADLSALEVLKQLKEIPNFKTPVIVMIKEVKESIKKHYLNDGFTDCIIKSKLESELERITENKS